MGNMWVIARTTPCGKEQHYHQPTRTWGDYETATMYHLKEYADHVCGVLRKESWAKLTGGSRPYVYCASAWHDTNDTSGTSRPSPT